MAFFIDFYKVYNYIILKHILMRIVSKALDRRPVEFFAKDESGNDISIKLGYHQFVFTPTKEKTRTININGRRGNLFIDFEEKPDFAEFFKPYTVADLERTKAILNGEIKPIAPTASNSVQANMDANEVKNQMIDEIENSDPYEALNVAKLAEEIPAPENDLQDIFANDLEEAGFEEDQVEEVEDKPKKRTSSKKGPGRPKKRGRPKKKNPRGRPPKNK